MKSTQRIFSIETYVETFNLKEGNARFQILVLLFLPAGKTSFAIFQFAKRPVPTSNQSTDHIFPMYTLYRLISNLVC